MNIFVLDEDPGIAAQMLCDKHVCKMIVETAQILSAAHHYYNTKFKDKVYKPTHMNHPCTKWVRESADNYDWTSWYLCFLMIEYHKRYQKIHKTHDIITFLYYNPVKYCGNYKLHTQFVQAIPDKYKCDDAVKAYRAYYLGEKMGFAKWKLGNEPDWVKEALK